MQSKLRLAINKMLGNAPARRLFDVEACIQSSFEAFPKNSVGKVPHAALDAIVRAYFLQEHGWSITGFEGADMTAKDTEVHMAAVLHERASEVVQALKEAKAMHQGFSLSDVVAVSAAVEQLILQESIPLLKTAYLLNAKPVEENVDENQLVDLLTSYLVLYRQGAAPISHPNATDMRRHEIYKRTAKDEDSWASIVQFVQHHVKGFTIAELEQNMPTGQYSFAAASQVVKELTRGYGKWQNSECAEMKADLMKLGAPGTGRVKFADFHAQPEHAKYQFTETEESLRKIGALDTSPDSGEGSDTVKDAAGSDVLVANYLAAPSNCIASSSLYAVCCLSECEALVNELQGRVQASMVTAQRLLDLVSEMASSTISAPRKLPDDIAEKARAMAVRHGGDVPLHSGDFRQWFHYVFPNECPLPTAHQRKAEDSEGIAAEEWADPKHKSTRIPAWQIKAEQAIHEEEL